LAAIKVKEINKIERDGSSTDEKSLLRPLLLNYITDFK
jgi:hypothetical protein